MKKQFYFCIFLSIIYGFYFDNKTLGNTEEIVSQHMLGYLGYNDVKGYEFIELLATQTPKVMHEISKFEKHESPSIRHWVTVYYGKIISDYSNNINKRDRLLLIEKLVFALNGESSDLTKRKIREILIIRGKKDFSDKAYDRLDEMFQNSVLDSFMIRLSGKLNFAGTRLRLQKIVDERFKKEKEAIDEKVILTYKVYHQLLTNGSEKTRKYLEETPYGKAYWRHDFTESDDQIIAQNMSRKKVTKFNRRKYGKSWSACLALARMGDEDMVDYCINTIKSETDLLKVFTKLVDDLSYINHSKATKALINYAHFDGIVETDSIPAKMLCRYAINALSRSLPNFPYKDISWNTAKKKDIELARDWLDKRAESGADIKF